MPRKHTALLRQTLMMYRSVFAAITLCLLYSLCRVAKLVPVSPLEAMFTTDSTVLLVLLCCTGVEQDAEHYTSARVAAVC
jgi:hypothetical protein